MIKTLWISAVIIALLVGTIRFMKKNDYAHYGREYAWYVEADEKTGAERLVKGRRINEIRQDANKLIFALNRSMLDGAQGGDGARELPQLRLLAIETGVARVEVMNSDYLGQRMGSSGAQGYLAAATFSLTENPSVRSVDFIFPAGEHAMPGIYSRETFSGFGSAPGQGAAAAGEQPVASQSTGTAGEADGKDRI